MKTNNVLRSFLLLLSMVGVWKTEAQAQDTQDAKDAVANIITEWCSKFGSRQFYKNSVTIEYSNNLPDGSIGVGGHYEYYSSNCNQVKAEYHVVLSKAAIGYKANGIMSKIPFCSFGAAYEWRWYAYKQGSEKFVGSFEEGAKWLGVE